MKLIISMAYKQKEIALEKSLRKQPEVLIESNFFATFSLNLWVAVVFECNPKANPKANLRKLS